MKLLIATKNPGKIKEIKEMLIVPNIELIIWPSLPDVIEDKGTMKENAIKKASEYAKLSSLLTLSEDSGLEVDYLDGAPSVYSARFGGDISYEEKNRLIIEMLKGIPFEKRKARFRSVVAIASPSGFLRTAEGIVDGFIAFEPKGNNGFGYDPIFFYPPFNKTFGEISSKEKNMVSHRGLAIKKIKGILEELLFGKAI